MEAQSEYVPRWVHVFARSGTDLHAQSVLIIKISASERSRKFIKSALLVGTAKFLLLHRGSLVFTVVFGL